MADTKSANDILGTGRRKTSVARVRLRPGSGAITVNGKPFDEYFTIEQDRRNVLLALDGTGRRNDYDVLILADGGGKTGQSGACPSGIARALKKVDGEAETVLRQQGLLTRDGRMKERKHYGLRGARRGTQFSKR